MLMAPDRMSLSTEFILLQHVAFVLNETCWNSKQNLIRESEKATAKAAYDKATQIYQQILSDFQ